MPPKPDRDAILNDLASRLLTTMVSEIVMDTAIEAHREIRHSRTLCDVCKTYCRQIHVPPTAAAASSSLRPPSNASRAPSPSIIASQDSATGADAGAPSGSKADGINTLECLNCQRAVAASRYAQHMSSCMGIGTGVRRTNSRNVTTKAKTSVNGRSASPYVEGDAPEEGRSVKGKEKAKSSSRLSVNDSEAGVKRPASPMVSPNKKQKGKQHPSQAPGGAKAEAELLRTPPTQRLAPPGSHRASSKLSSVASSIAPPPSASTTASSKSRRRGPQSSHPSRSRSRSGSPGSESSSDTPIASAASASTPSSSIAGNSPTLPSAEAIGKSGRKLGRPGSAQAQAKRALQMPPPAPPPPSILPPPIHRLPDPDYLIDVEGEETGSSSDTDND